MGDTVDTTVDTHTDMAMDIMAEKRGPLKRNQKQKPAQMLGMDTEDMVDIMVATMAEKNDPPRLKLSQKLMLVPMLGMDMEATDTDIRTDTDTTVKCHAIETVPAKTTLPSSL